MLCPLNLFEKQVKIAISETFLWKPFAFSSCTYTDPLRAYIIVPSLLRKGLDSCGVSTKSLLQIAGGCGFEKGAKRVISQNDFTHYSLSRSLLFSPSI